MAMSVIEADFPRRCRGNIICIARIIGKRQPPKASHFSARQSPNSDTQSTLSRQVAALEIELGVTLFERVGRSVVVTQAESGLLEYARTMGGAAHELALAATGTSKTVDGVVSVTATDAVAAFLLPRAIQRISEVDPGGDYRSHRHRRDQRFTSA